ncbi:hypothetical protein ACPW96_21515 [Micromonospora sp. DT81.3]|uniref:hypothetical protein n=1 Tax=Micromonospora sp. DT81.3 TaxID=3416523 RepID=UPI003CFAF6E5
MRAFPLNRDSIDLLVTAACITTTAHRSDAVAADIVITADALGQLLWDENHSSVSFATGEHITAPRYDWQPVAEIIPTADGEQLLQIERTRLLFEEVSCHHDGWDYSTAGAVMEALRAEISTRLAGRSLVSSSDNLGVLEYDGLSRAAEMWDRTIGFRYPLEAGTAA